MWGKKIIDIQDPSTKALMLAQNERPEEDDSQYFQKIRLTKVDMKAQCTKEDGTVDLNVRNISQKEANIEESLRLNRGEAIENLRPQATTPTLTEEKRDRGTSAFMRAFSVDALKHKFKMVMKDLFKPSHAEIMAEAIRKTKDEK